MVNFKQIGGKTRLLDSIVPLLCRRGPITHYVEPFLGSGAVFFDLHARGLLKHAEVHLNDLDIHTMALHQAARTDWEAFHSSICDAVEGWNQQTSKEAYLDLRLRYNTRTKDGQSPSPVLGYMLRKLCFNGIWRVNGSGEMNVPWNKKTILEPPSLYDFRTWGEALENVTLGTSSALDLLGLIVEGQRAQQEEGLAIYLDPPYFDTFSSYTRLRFDGTHHTHLVKLAAELCNLGANVVYSNIASLEVDYLLKTLWPSAVQKRLTASDTIGGAGASRKGRKELLCHSP